MICEQKCGDAVRLGMSNPIFIRQFYIILFLADVFEKSFSEVINREDETSVRWIFLWH